MDSSLKISNDTMVDNQMDSTLLSDLVKFCGVFENVILHEVSYWEVNNSVITLSVSSTIFFIGMLLFQPSDFSYPRLTTLEITVHQLILTYDTSKPSNLRNSSIKRYHSFQDNDNQEEDGKEKLEVCNSISI